MLGFHTQYFRFWQRPWLQFLKFILKKIIPAILKLTSLQMGSDTKLINVNNSISIYARDALWLN